MSSKVEKTSYQSHQHPRSSIFFRNPLLLKIVAWLGSLISIGSSGNVWADLMPTATSSQPGSVETSETAVLAAASNIAKSEDRQTYGPYLPVSQPQSPVRVHPGQLPNREVPQALAPGSASILPTGTIVRPQHTDLLTADNYTVGVNGSAATTPTEIFVNIPVPAPRSAIVPTANREVVTMTNSQVQPNYLKSQRIVDRSVPTTSIQTQVRSESGNSNRSTPAVTNLPTVTGSPRGVSNPTPIATNSRKGISSTVVTPMKPLVKAASTNPQPELSSPTATASLPVTAPSSIEIAVPAPRTQQIVVAPVAQLPKIGVKVVPPVPTLPSVRTAAFPNAPSQPLTFVNPATTNEPSTSLIFPLSSPAPMTSSFGWRTHPITGSRRFHSGVDLGAPMGAPVVATGSGTIVSAGWFGGYGKAIVIQHNGVQQTLYGHLSEVFVQAGQRIEQGTVIGRVGSTGNSTGPHLHFETRVSTADGWVAVDPSDDVRYALDNLRNSMPFAQGQSPQGIN
jgi:murein DD-endopeptidase MepM/ murein hydrolase activator NlpD